MQAQSPPALLARAQHIATRCMQLHTPFFFMMPSCTYACRGCTYHVICTGHRVRSGRGHSGQAGCQRPGVCMDSSGSVHEGLLGGLYTLTSSHPLDLQQIGTRREGKNLRLSQLEPKWHHDPGGSVYQLTHADSLIYKHISHTLNVTLRLNY